MNRKLSPGALCAFACLFTVGATVLASPRIPGTGGPLQLQDTGSNGFGVLGYGVSGVYGAGSTDAGYGVYGSVSTGTQNAGVYGLSTATNGSGVKGQADYGSFAYGVWGKSAYGNGVKGESINGYGVLGSGRTGVYGTGDGPNGNGVLGSGRTGVVGESSVPGGIGVAGHGAGQGGVGLYGSAEGGYAGWFSGDVRITGACCGSAAGTYQIDDPLDPEGKYLNSAAVESADLKMLYDGDVTLDRRGEAWVEVPTWFAALNRDFHYQLTAIGVSAPGLYVASEIANNRFRVAGGRPGMKVSWQVTGVRHDPYAEAHRLPAEQDKPAGEKGHYLHPELYAQAPNQGLDPYTRSHQQGR